MYDMVLTASDINFKILAKDKKIVSCNIIIVAGTIFYLYNSLFPNFAAESNNDNF